jgi:hypothetical protein
MIINENKQLTENFFEELVPKYAKICGDDFPKSGYYKEGIQFTQAESDEKIKQKFNHNLKSIVMKRFGQYYDENEIEQNFDVLLKNTTPHRYHWSWCGIKPDTEEFKKFVPEPNNVHFNVNFEISIETKNDHSLSGMIEMETFNNFVI